MSSGPRSPHTDPLGACREVEERVATHATRSLHQTEPPYHARYGHVPDHQRYSDWEDFRANCHPTTIKSDLARRWRSAASLAEDLNELRILLIAAHLRLDRFEALTELPHRKATAA